MCRQYNVQKKKGQEKLNIPKEQSEYVNWRGADNTMAIKKKG